MRVPCQQDSKSHLGFGLRLSRLCICCCMGRAGKWKAVVRNEKCECNINVFNCTIMGNKEDCFAIRHHRCRKNKQRCRLCQIPCSGLRQLLFVGDYLHGRKCSQFCQEGACEAPSPARPLCNIDFSPQPLDRKLTTAVNDRYISKLTPLAKKDSCSQTKGHHRYRGISQHFFEI